MNMYCAFCLVAVLSLGQLLAADPVKPKRESIEWLDVWVTQGDHPEAAPRVLLIGDSITRGYYPEVQKRLKGKVVCDRLATSVSLGDPLLLSQVELVASQYRYDVVHVNNGMHGFDYTEAQYGAAIIPLLKTIQRVAPRAKLVWATTTPVAGDPALERNKRISERNRLVHNALKGTQVAIDDLHAVIAANTALISKDGVHLLPAGYEALADQVARALTLVLPEGK